MLNGCDGAKEFIGRVDEKVDWLTEAISTSKHSIHSAPVDIAMERDSKRDCDAALNLQALKVHNALARCLNLDGKCSNSRANVKRVTKNAIHRKGGVKFPDHQSRFNG